MRVSWSTAVSLQPVLRAVRILRVNTGDAFSTYLSMCHIQQTEGAGRRCRPRTALDYSYRRSDATVSPIRPHKHQK